MRTSEAQLYLCSLFSVYPTGDSMIGLIDWLCPTGLFSKIPNYHVWSNISWTWGRYWSEGNNFFFSNQKRLLVLFFSVVLTSISPCLWGHEMLLFLSSRFGCRVNAKFWAFSILQNLRDESPSNYSPEKKEQKREFENKKHKMNIKIQFSSVCSSVQFSLQFSTVQWMDLQRNDRVCVSGCRR